MAAGLLLVLLAATGCQQHAPTRTQTALPPSPVAADALLPSPRLLVGRVIAVDRRRAIAVLELAPDAPPAAIAPGVELIARTDDLVETARLQATRIVRARTFGTKIVSGQPSPGDEVVWLAP